MSVGLRGIITARQCVVERLGGKYGKVSVRQGTGTARPWLRVSTEKVVPYELQRLIESQLVEMSLAAFYYTDTGISDAYIACVNWDTRI